MNIILIPTYAGEIWRQFDVAGFPNNLTKEVFFRFEYRGNITSGLWTLNTTLEDLVRARYNTGTTPSPSGRHSASTGGKRRTDGHVTVAGQQTCQPML